MAWQEHKFYSSNQSAYCEHEIAIMDRDMSEGTTLGICTKLGSHVQIASFLSIEIFPAQYSGSGIPWAMRGEERYELASTRTSVQSDYTNSNQASPGE